MVDHFTSGILSLRRHHFVFFLYQLVNNIGNRKKKTKEQEKETYEFKQFFEWSYEVISTRAKKKFLLLRSLRLISLRRWHTVLLFFFKGDSTHPTSFMYLIANWEYKLNSNFIYFQLLKVNVDIRSDKESFNKNLKICKVFLF